MQATTLKINKQTNVSAKVSYNSCCTQASKQAWGDWAPHLSGDHGPSASQIAIGNVSYAVTVTSSSNKEQ